jgi:hypothetical protein
MPLGPVATPLPVLRLTLYNMLLRVARLGLGRGADSSVNEAAPRAGSLPLLLLLLVCLLDFLALVQCTQPREL